MNKTHATRGGINPRPRPFPPKENFIYRNP